MIRAYKCIVLVLFITLLAACSSKSAMQPMMSDSTMMNMPMNTAHNHNTGDAIAHFSVQASSQSLRANQDVTIKILIQNKRSQPIDSFDRLHEKLLHLFVVSKD
jgi:type IV pilus biogenesis protein CpaD/CtpE